MDFEEILSASSNVDFSDPAYQASGKSRVRIKNTLLFYADMISVEDLPTADTSIYREILNKYPK